MASAQEFLDLHPDGTVNLYTLQAVKQAHWHTGSYLKQPRKREGVCVAEIPAPNL